MSGAPYINGGRDVRRGRQPPLHDLASGRWSVYAALISAAGAGAFDALSQLGKVAFGVVVATPIAANVWAT